MNNREKFPSGAGEIKETNASGLLRETKRKLIAELLISREGIHGVEAWRDIDSEGRAARGMRRFFDTLSAYDAAIRTVPSAKETLAEEIKKSAGATGETHTRVEELRRLFLAKKIGEESGAARPDVKKIFNSLCRADSSEGVVDVSELLTSSKTPLTAKAAWFESYFLSGLKFLERCDLADARERVETPPPEEILKAKEKAPTENLPPPAGQPLKPSMEEMIRSKEGEPGVWFAVSPFYGGYYREEDFDFWNSRVLEWEPRVKEFKKVQAAELSEKTKRVIGGTVRPGAQTALPMPYGFRPDAASLKIYGKGKIEVLEDGFGGYTVQAEGEKPISFSVEIGRSPAVFEEKETAPLKIETGGLSSETELKLKEVKESGGLPMEKARMLKVYVKKTLAYSNDSAMNAVYRGGDPAQYFQRIEQHKKADCDVANTFFAALLSRLEIPVRIVGGHYVKTKDSRGNAVISSGTRHAWVEIWDGSHWQRLDATPPGDQNMDDEETDEEKDDTVFEGDFGEEEAKEISDEELEEMIEKAKVELERAEKKEIPKSEIEALRFAEDAGCSKEEAKEILRQIEAARELRDRQGRKIRNRLVAEFQKIVRENRVERLRYKAPVRLSDAHELVDPVEAMLDIYAGEADPSGFAKRELKIEREQIYGGFDAIFVVDKSGSMAETDPKSGQPKWSEQQKFVFLFMDALYFAAQEFKREKIRLVSPIDIRSGLVSFQDGGATVELPFGSVWGPKEQYKVWKALQKNVGGGTPDHLGLASAQKIIEEDIAAYPKEKKRLRLVLVSADGGSDNKTKTMAAKETLKSLGVVVKAAGIGAGAREVKATYFPDGENLPDFAAAPDWASEHVIAEAKKLYPKKIKR